ncbi:hypothetical protein IM543_14345 [Massilia sp. UMI-21]|nr:hypothetical protein IM543_14345 [Massilia sp. UMI-21]
MADVGTLDRLSRNKKVLFAASAAIGGFISALLTQGLGLGEGAFTSWVLAGGLDAACIGAAVVYAQSYYQTRSLKVRDGLKKAAKTGLVAGCAGGLAALFGMNLFGAGNVGRMVGWAISGGVAGYVVAQQVPNLRRKPAIVAGACGGAVGCLVMYMEFGYATGVAITGAAIGLMVAMAESMFRKNWIDVEVYAHVLGNGLNLAKPERQFTLNIGADPITIGTHAGLDIEFKADPGSAPGHTASIYCDGDKTIYHDLQNGSRAELSAGQPFRFGACQVRLGS